MVKQISLSLRMRSFHNGTNYLVDRLFGYQGNLIQAKTIYLAGSMVEYQTGDWIGFPNGEENLAMLPRPRNYRLIKFEKRSIENKFFAPWTWKLNPWIEKRKEVERSRTVSLSQFSSSFLSNFFSRSFSSKISKRRRVLLKRTVVKRLSPFDRVREGKS